MTRKYDCEYGEWLRRSAYGTRASASISRRLIAREKSIDIAHSNASHEYTSADSAGCCASVVACSAAYSLRSFRCIDSVESTTADPCSSASSSSAHVKLCPTSSVVGRMSTYGAQNDAAPAFFSARSRSASATVPSKPAATLATGPDVAGRISRPSGTRNTRSPVCGGVGSR